MVGVVWVGVRFGRRAFDYSVARVMGYRNWVLEAEAANRQQLRAVLAANARLEAQIDGLQDRVLVQLAEMSRNHQQACLAAEEHARTLEHAIDELQQQLRESGAAAATAARYTSRIDEITSHIDLLVAELAARETQPTQVESALAAVSARSEQAGADLLALSVRTSQIEGLIRTTVARRCAIPPVDSFLPESEEDLVRLAESLAVLRPLVPYPEWRFDADKYNPDLSFQLRQRVWQAFLERHCEAPIMMPWHLRTRLQLYLNNDLSSQIFVAGCIDPNEFAFLDKFLRPGMTFVDVGANEGIYSIFAASCVGRGGVVWAFEPSARELERLQRNRESNDLDFRIFPVGLSDTNGTAELLVAEDSHGGLNTLGGIAYAGVAEARRESIPLRRLDDVIAENAPARVDIIKIDVEGAELQVLRGAAESLRRYRPLLLFEVLLPALVKQGTSPEELMDYVRAQGYVLHQFDGQTGLPAIAQPAEYTENMIAVPEECSLPEVVYRYLPIHQNHPEAAAIESGTR